MLDPLDHEWWPKIDPPFTPQPLTNEPPFKVFEIRPCHGCGALIDRELCGYCEFRFIDEYPALAAMRRDVRDWSRLSDWHDVNHTHMQTIWQMAAPKGHSWQLVFYALIQRALARYFGHARLHQARPWFFHPEDFGNEEAA